MKALALALLVGATAWAQAPDPARLRESVRVLASDEMGGRAPGQPGAEKAASYLIERFREAGLEPAGENGTYEQKVPLLGVSTQEGTGLTLETPAGKRELRLWDDFTVNNPSGQEDSRVEAPIVFVGFGIDSPENAWNDYKDVDLHGKVALLFTNEPLSEREDFFQGKALTYSGRWTYKFEETARRGALATLIIHRTDLAAYGWEVVRNSWRGEKSYLDQPNPNPAFQAAAWLHLDVARQLLQDCGQDLDRLYMAAQSPTFRPIELPARLRCQVRSRVRHYSSTNLIGRKPGGALADQAVFYSAHYDHLGARDGIYNGALDNASGCAVLLELARCLRAETHKRAFYFLCTTAEEQGLLGAAYLAAHPPLSLKNVSLDLNFDMIPPWGVPEEVVALGSERTTFGPTVARLAAGMSLGLRPDPSPGAGLYYRMDHFSLAQAGVPGFSVGEGVKFQGHPAEWGQQKYSDYTAHDYHQPSDEFHSDWDFTGMGRFVEFCLELGRTAADQDDLVQWRAGDEFEAARKKSQ